MFKLIFAMLATNRAPRSLYLLRAFFRGHGTSRGAGRFCFACFQRTKQLKCANDFTTPQRLEIPLKFESESRSGCVDHSSRIAALDVVPLERR